jgi:glycosyltransferase involved in cell wall biosynthesis
MNNRQQTSDDTARPLVSVVIPVYNRPEELKRALGSVIRQTYSNMEILVVNDGSEVEISPTIENLNDCRISYFEMEHRNANVARNYGIEKSRGKYIAMLDADDVWFTDHVEDCLRTLWATNADGLYGSLIINDLKRNGDERQVIVRSLNKGETMMDYLLSKGCGAQTSTLFMTAQSAKDILWDPQLGRHQDYDFVNRYSKRYKLAAKLMPTVCVCRDGAEPPKTDFRSCIRAIKKNKRDISPRLYGSYHMGMLSLARSQKAPRDIIKHYQTEAVRYTGDISFHRFLEVKNPRGRMQKLRYKLEYLLRVLRQQ